MYQRLVLYKAEYGHCLVPRKYENDQKLSTWVETQRVLWNRDYRRIDPNEAVEAAATTAAATSVALAEYGGGSLAAANQLYEFVPTMMTQTADGRDSGYAQDLAASLSVGMHQFNVETDIPGVPAMPANPDAAKVAADKGKRLTLERKRKLDELGFVWSLRSKRIEDHWDEMFKQLQEYKDQHGDCLVPSRHEQNLKLGKWVSSCHCRSDCCFDQ